jgi:hypothetical protein
MPIGDDVTFKRSPSDSLICSVLRGIEPAWPWPNDAAREREFIDWVEYHGVAVLLHEQASRMQAWPESIQQAIRNSAFGQAMWELRHQEVLSEVVGALAEKAIEPIIFKGTALAYGLYGNPVRRPRGDTDMIVSQDEAVRAEQTLVNLGFDRCFSVAGDFVSYQTSFTRKIENGGEHTIDLHRRINNSELLSRLFSYQELKANAQPLPLLCDGALAAGSVHALLLACLHPATHKHNPYVVNGVAHYGGDRLIWHHDVHLLANSLSQEQWGGFLDCARSKGLCGPSRDGLDRAVARYETRVPPFVQAGLEATGEKVEAYLKSSRMRQFWIDLLAIGSVAGRMRFVYELVFPSTDYVRRKYGQSAALWLPWLYIRRATTGLLRRLGDVGRAK